MTTRVYRRGESRGDDVARSHAAGLTVRQIAAALDMSTQGVRWHLDKLGLKPNTPRRNGEEAPV